MYKIAFTFKKPDEHTLSLIRETGFTKVITSYKNIDKNLLAEIKKYGLHIWVEIGCFIGKDLWQKYPNSKPAVKNIPIEKLGSKQNKWYAGVTPLPEVIEDRLLLIKYILTKYSEIEILYLDFCRFPGRWEDGQGNAIFADNAENNVDKRQEIISGFVRRVSKISKDYNVKLGIFLTPYDNPQYGQNIQTLSNLCDFLSPMLYHKICRQPSSWIGKQIQSYAVMAGKPILPVIQTIPEPSPLSLSEFKQAYLETYKEDGLGAMILSWESMTREMRELINEF